MAQRGATALDKSALRNEYELLYLNYHRNKNQHRGATWFKFLNILVRNLRKILVGGSARLQAQTARYLHARIVPKAYYAFQGIVAQGQFITLGFALVGSLAKVDALIAGVAAVGQSQGQIKDQVLGQVQGPAGAENVVELDTGGQDIGEAVTAEEQVRLAPAATQRPGAAKPVPKTHTKTSTMEKSKSGPKRTIDDIFGNPKKKSKKSKKKSAIDDIFG